MEMHNNSYTVVLNHNKEMGFTEQYTVLTYLPEEVVAIGLSRGTVLSSLLPWERFSDA